MKRVILAAVTLVSVVFAGTANAQSATDNVTLNINLKPIHTILVNSGQKTVNLTYSTPAHYLAGVGENQLDHLEIFSTGAFVVNVKTGGNFLASNGGTIAASGNSTVLVTPAAGTANPIPGSPTYSPIGLTSSDQQLIKSATGGRNMKVSVNYKGAGSDEYLNKFSKTHGVDENVFTAQVTYTILAD